MAWAEFAAVVAAFAISRVCAWAAGVRFDATSLPWYWQYLEVDLLRDDLARSLLYLHAQPPLFNTFLGLGVKIGGDDPTWLFATLYRLEGLALALILLALLRGLRVERTVALTATVLFTISPTALLYENWLFYTWPMALVLLAAAWFLHRGVLSARTADLAAFFAAVAVAAMTRSTFHLVWVFACVGGALLVARVPRRTVIAAAAIPVLLVTGLYLKNAMVFGTFSASSWLGLSLGRLTVARLEPEDGDRLVREGVLSEIAGIRPFTPLHVYPPRWIEPTGRDVPALRRRFKGNGYPNFNFHPVLKISETYRSDALAVIRNRPLVYLGSVAESWRLFGFPPSEIEFVDDNRAHIRGWDRLYNVLGGQPAGIRDFDVTPVREDPSYQVTRVVWIWMAAALAGVVYGLARGIRLLRFDDLPNRARGAALVFAAATSLWVAVVSNLVELGENNRFRAMIDPMLVVLVAVMVSDAVVRVRARRRAR